MRYTNTGSQRKQGLISGSKRCKWLKVRYNKKSEATTNQDRTKKKIKRTIQQSWFIWLWYASPCTHSICYVGIPIAWNTSNNITYNNNNNNN